MPKPQTAFQIMKQDNVATALCSLSSGIITLLGDIQAPTILIAEPILIGHKLALRDIAFGEDIIKYGVVIGRATQPITQGSWVHLHCIQSLYDERSNHLDIMTGAPTDTKYE